jgi:hypothetical protein
VLILEIALGIILACVAIGAAPILFGGLLGAAAHAIVALTKPRKLSLRLSSAVLWTVGICIAIVIVCYIDAAP